MNLADQIAYVLKRELGANISLSQHQRVAIEIAAMATILMNPRIETVEQLNALPVEALIGYHDSTRTFRRLWTADDGDSEHFWQEPGGYDYRSADIPLPAIVLWHPGDTD